jgi:two-component system, OmpR family, sensor histidine kinase KdpD
VKEAKVSAQTNMRLYRLFQLAQRLLVLEPQIAEGTSLVEPFQGVFGATAICLYDAVTDRAYSIGPTSGELEGRARAAYTAGQDQDDPAAGIAIRSLTTQGRTTGAIAFHGLENPRLTAVPLAALAAALHEGIRLRRETAQAAVAAEVDAFRLATFDVLGSECKNALTTILAATGGLREAGPLRAEQLEMARMVEEEASRLGHLISRLDWIARLDQGEVYPRLDSTNLTALVAQAVDHWSRIAPDRQILLASPEVAFTTLADPELLRLALSQLLDNACKFSAPGSTVHVDIEVEIPAGIQAGIQAGMGAGMGAHGSTAVVSVFSDGDPIPRHEQVRIFERSYMGARGSNFATGSGLGLYAARKIAVAHGGTLDLDPEKMRTNCVAFRLSLPRADGPLDG